MIAIIIIMRKSPFTYNYIEYFDFSSTMSEHTNMNFFMGFSAEIQYCFPSGLCSYYQNRLEFTTFILVSNGFDGAVKKDRIEFRSILRNKFLSSANQFVIQFNSIIAFFSECVCELIFWAIKTCHLDSNSIIN